MPYSSVADMEKSMTVMKDMTPKQKSVMFEVFNSMMKDGKTEQQAIAGATSAAKKVKENAEDMMPEHMMPEDMKKPGGKDAKMAREDMTKSWYSEKYFSNVPVSINDPERSTVEILRTGKWNGSKGKFEITGQMLDDFARSFKEKIYRTDLQVNLSHKRESVAAGWFKDVYRKGTKLLADIEWTKVGKEALKEKIYRFFSSEIDFEYFDEETGKTVKNVLLGGALTNVPYIKGLQPVMYSEDVDTSLFSNFFNMKAFQIFSESLLARSTVTKIDFETMQKMFAELPAEEQEAAKADVAKVEAKVMASEKVKSEVKPEETKPAEQEKSLAEENKTLRLQLAETTKLAQSVSHKLALAEVSTEVKKLMLSEKNTTGFAKADLPDVEKFAVGLAEAKRPDFYALCKKIKHVELSEIGHGLSTEENSDDPEVKAKQLHAKITAFAEEKNLSYIDAAAHFGIK